MSSITGQDGPCLAHKRVNNGGPSTILKFSLYMRREKEVLSLRALDEQLSIGCLQGSLRITEHVDNYQKRDFANDHLR